MLLSPKQPISKRLQHTVKYISIARQRVTKHSRNTRASNSRTSIARQRRDKHAFEAIEETVFSMCSAPSILTCNMCFPWGPCKVVVRSVRQDRRSSSRRNTAEYTTAVSELAAVEMARKELDGAKKTSRVIWSYSETVINPLQGRRRILVRV
jgi:hypothetical protein